MGQSDIPHKQTYLIKKVKEQAESFHESMRIFRQRHFRLSITAVSLAGAITLFTAINVKINYASLSLLIVALGVMITIITTYTSFYNPRETWLLYHDSLSKLQALLAKIEYNIEEDTTIDDTHLDRFFEAYQTILREHSNKYSQIRVASQKSNVIA